MGSEQQVATMDTVRDLSSALWSLRTSQEAARLLRTSLSLLRCFLFFDICYLIGGITLISMALSNQVKDQDNRMVFAGGLLTLFGSLSAMCNSLASHGLRTWRRAFLLPWLLFLLLAQVPIVPLGGHLERGLLGQLGDGGGDQRRVLQPHHAHLRRAQPLGQGGEREAGCGQHGQLRPLRDHSHQVWRHPRPRFCKVKDLHCLLLQDVPGHCADWSCSWSHLSACAPFVCRTTSDPGS